MAISDQDYGLFQTLVSSEFNNRQITVTGSGIPLPSSPALSGLPANSFYIDTSTSPYVRYEKDNLGNWNEFTGSGGGSIDSRVWITKDHNDSPYTIADGGEYILTDTSGGVLTLSLPPTPSEGDSVCIVPLAPTYTTNPLTILRNGELINEKTDDLVVDENALALEFVFIGANVGWALFKLGETVIINRIDANGLNDIVTETSNSDLQGNIDFSGNVDFTSAVSVTGLPSGTTLPPDADGVLTNTSGTLSWETLSSGSTLPGDADGVLTNTSGTLSWESLSGGSTWAYHNSSFTAVAGGKYLVDNDSSTIITMPASALANDETIEIVHVGYMEGGDTGPSITVPDLVNDRVRFYSTPTASSFVSSYTMKSGEHVIITNNTFPTGFTGNIFSISSDNQEFIGEKDTYIRVDTSANKIELRPDETTGFPGYLLLDQSTGFNIAEFREGLTARFYDTSDSIGISISGDDLTIPQTGSLRLPDETNTDTGTGSLRYNRTSDALEVYDAGWNEISGLGSFVETTGEYTSPYLTVVNTSYMMNHTNQAIYPNFNLPATPTTGEWIEVTTGFGSYPIYPQFYCYGNGNDIIDSSYDSPSLPTYNSSIDLKRGVTYKFVYDGTNWLVKTISDFNSNSLNSYTSDGIISITSGDLVGGMTLNAGGTNGTLSLTPGALGEVKLTTQTASMNSGAPSDLAIATKKYADDEDIINISSATYTIQATDNGKVLYFTNNAPITLTVPTGLSVGFNFKILQGNSLGVITWSGAAILTHPLSHVNTNGVGSTATFISPVSGTFFISGTGTST